MPGGALVTRVSEALHVSPLCVPEKFVSDTAFARWGPELTSCCCLVPLLCGLDLKADNSLEYPNKDDQAKIVMNSGFYARLLDTTVELLHAAAEIWCMLAPTRSSATCMMLSMVVFEFYKWVFESPYQQLCDRRKEWARRKREIEEADTAIDSATD